MKATGIVRQLDDVGRVVLPKELREIFDMRNKDSVEIFTTEEGIFIKKYNPGCDLCGKFRGIKIYHGKKICIECQKVIAEDQK